MHLQAREEEFLSAHRPKTPTFRKSVFKSIKNVSTSVLWCDILVAL
jgi:hypothetical protein